MYTELKMRKTSGKINISIVKYGMGIQTIPFLWISYITHEDFTDLQNLSTVCPESSDPTYNIESNYFIQNSSRDLNLFCSVNE